LVYRVSSSNYRELTVKDPGIIVGLLTLAAAIFGSKTALLVIGLIVLLSLIKPGSSKVEGTNPPSPKGAEDE
jgi:hypothetical protein